MRKTLLLFMFVGSGVYVTAQSGMLTLKKGSKPIERYFNSDYINCRLETSEWIDAYIIKIYNDSMELKPFELTRYINSIGIPSLDTLWKNRRKIAIANIDAFPRRDQSYPYIKNGAILQIIGGGYIFLNVVNTLSSGDGLFEDNNGVNLAIGAAIFAVGTIIHLNYSDVLKIGKKYKLQYVDLSPSP